MMKGQKVNSTCNAAPRARIWWGAGRQHHIRHPRGRRPARWGTSSERRGCLVLQERFHFCPERPSHGRSAGADVRQRFCVAGVLPETAPRATTTSWGFRQLTARTPSCGPSSMPDHCKKYRHVMVKRGSADRNSEYTYPEEYKADQLGCIKDNICSSRKYRIKNKRKEEVMGIRSDGSLVISSSANHL
ncbi:hypothetical protein CEXT_397071 [Caerostris extrusa]|uniref:Uncharacterized protein n=1 Tax=Caerostris extrusa TaxID=172846 RepID=A0AAV4WBI6_CAEEX|nr:hypothetical protein CEXT_397071 [Caerostris extrusa]